jgi:hypothetical protein
MNRSFGRLEIDCYTIIFLIRSGETFTTANKKTTNGVRDNHNIHFKLTPLLA